MTATWRNLITPPWTQCYSRTRVLKIKSAQNCPRNFMWSLRLETSRCVNTERRHAALFHNVEFSTLSIFCTLAFKLVMGLMLRIPTQIAEGLQLIHIRDGLCCLGIHVCCCFRCRPLPTFPMWKFMHRKQRSASAWDKDFVNVSDRFSLVGTLVTCKSFLYRLL